MSQLQPADGGEGEYYDEEDGEGEAAEATEKTSLKHV